MSLEKQHISNLYSAIEDQKEFKLLGESLNRLKSNKDFIKVFDKFIFDKVIKDKLNELVLSKNKESNEIYLKQIIGIQSIKVLLEQIQIDAEMAEHQIEAAQHEINNLIGD